MYHSKPAPSAIDKIASASKVLLFQDLLVLIMKHKPENTENTADSDLPFLKVGTAPTAVTIESEAFVRMTVRGYVPCLRVKVLKNELMYALIIGSKSISEALESLRKENGGFLGLEIEICKKGEEQTSPYLVNKLK